MVGRAIFFAVLASCVSDPPIPPSPDPDAGPDAAPDPCDAPDADGDGHVRSECGGDDCADSDAETYPGAVDTVGDGVDQDCDRLDGVDADEDGYASEASGGDDCDDGHAEISPGAEKIPGEDWLLEVPDEGDTGGTPSIVVDEDDVIHILYYDIPQGAVRYVNGTPGAWSTPELIDVEGYHQDVALAVHDGTAHAVFEGWESDVLGYVGGVLSVWYGRKEPGGAWELQRLDYGWATVLPSIAVSDDGVVHVAWSHWSGGSEPFDPVMEVRYASDASGVFETETVEAWEFRTFSPWIAVDPDGAPRVAYAACQVVGSCYDGEDRAVHLATKTGAEWDVETVAPGGTYIPAVTLAIDPDGHSHLAWGGAEGGPFVYATDASGAWVQDVLVEGVPGGQAGVGPHIAVDSAGHVGIAYIDWSPEEGAMKFTSNKTGEWSVANVDIRGTGAYQVSLDFDSHDSPHIAYFQSDEWYLGYAHTDGLDQNCDGVDW